MSSRRAKRVAELMKEEISSIILQDLRNPNIGLVTITEVRLTDDLSYARVFVSVYGEDKNKSKSLDSLRRASGFIRRELSRRIRLRHFPELRFLRDSSIEQGVKITKLLEKIEHERKSERPAQNS